MLPARVLRVLERLFSTAGQLDAAIRQAAAARAATLAGGSQTLSGSTDIPAPLAAWVDKVARHAHRCTDEDLAALTRAGYSEDQVFEATLAAAVGAGVSRFERGLSLLRSAK